MNRSFLALLLVASACGDSSPVSGEPGAKQEDEPEVRDAGTMRDASTARIDASRPAITPTPRVDAGGCDTALEITVRDFTEMHPDFESFSRDVKGIVESQLGPDKKPVYAHTGGTISTTGPDEFAQWYNDVDGVNQRLSHRLQFTEKSAGVYVYDSSDFFPIDGMGFGNGPNGGGGITIPGLGTIGGGGDAEHNFLFTTEAHTVFSYRGGETFSFSGDDDMWVFLNGKLAIDLGGTHSELSASIDLDAEATRLGLVKGNTYAMDIFHAERHTNESNYHIETTINLSCIENIPVI
ncbi:MAG: fibro-slime domain-containing protein [Polyangiales bacterium]